MATQLDFNDQETLFVEVILPLSLSKNYTYRVPAQFNAAVAPGKRVIVQFGKQRMYTALVKSIGNKAPELYEAKYIIDVIDDHPILNTEQQGFWDWIASYYLCNEGDVMAAALPAGLKLASETMIALKEEAEPVSHVLSEKEEIVLGALSRHPKISVEEIGRLLGQKTVYPVINALLDKNLIVIIEEVSEKYRPLLKSFVALNDFYKEEENLKQLFGILERAPKQLDALLAYIQRAKQPEPISKQELMELSNCGPGAFKALLDKEVFSVYKQAVSRLDEVEKDSLINFKLSSAQAAALDSVKESFERKDVVLLHGVTASGKTQLYIKLIEDALLKDQQVLFLVPEIALTTQIVERISIYFGEKVGVYHSKFNNNQRVEIWNKVLNNQYKIVLGARSAVFLPFKKLGLVVVDEEHEASFKQYDPAPRYQARDAAIYLAGLYQAKVLLGSATPSLESYYNAAAGKYGLVKLEERFGGVLLPAQQVVNIAEETKKKMMTAYFSNILLEEIALALKNKEQVILFQNRRGYATILICATCGYTPKCINCDVSLTYHKASGKLHCHYCGFAQSVLNTCPACGSVHIMQKGFGTERIEEELRLLFPDIRTARLDLDSTRSRNSMQNIITAFRDKQTDVLVGTQMVAKGLDFENVTLIGVINADTLLNYPDFRAYERSYQLLAQVAGRAGRRAKQGKVLIQAYDAGNRIIKQVASNNYTEMYEIEINEREQFNYPPFTRLISLNIKHKDAQLLHKAALILAQRLREGLGERVLGPEQPLIARVRNFYIEQILIKIEKTAPVKKVKIFLKNTIQEFNAEKGHKSVSVQVDVDPM